MNTDTVSIHAPVKGATIESGDDRWLSDEVSIHAPVKGATAIQYIQDMAHVVSIHAPVKGATCAR